MYKKVREINNTWLKYLHARKMNDSYLEYVNRRTRQLLSVEGQLARMRSRELSALERDSRILTNAF
jgi:hypothetical protein